MNEDCWKIAGLSGHAKTRRARQDSCLASQLAHRTFTLKTHDDTARRMATALDAARIKGPRGRFEYVGAVFTWLAGNCTQETMAESYEIMKTTLDRFEAARKAFREHESRGKQPDLVVFLHALRLFYKTVREYTGTTDSVAERVVNYLDLMQRLGSYHGNKDGLDRVTQDHRDAGLHFVGSEKFEVARAAYQTKVDVRLNEFISEVKRNLVKNQEALNKANRVLQTAMKNNPSKWRGNDLAQKMELDISALAQEAFHRSLNGTETWFITEDKVTIDPNSFASGASATVHLGEWSTQAGMDGSQVAVKRLKPFSCGDRENLRREVKLWKELSHENILNLYGACDSAFPPWLICEHAKGGDLMSHLASPVGKQHVWHLLHQIAVGIAYLHEQNIIHADLKLNNFLLGNDGKAKITDFGMSRLKVSSRMYASDSREDGDRSVGALRWRAPECVGDGRVSAQFSSDVFSFGMCIYEAFERQPPYWYIPDDVAVVALIAQGQLPQRPDNMPDEAWSLFVRMTSQDQLKRPPIQEVVKELKVFADKERHENEKKGREMYQRQLVPQDNQMTHSGQAPQHQPVPMHQQVSQTMSAPQSLQAQNVEALQSGPVPQTHQVQIVQGSQSVPTPLNNKRQGIPALQSVPAAFQVPIQTISGSGWSQGHLRQQKQHSLRLNQQTPPNWHAKQSRHPPPYHQVPQYDQVHEYEQVQLNPPARGASQNYQLKQQNRQGQNTQVAQTMQVSPRRPTHPQNVGIQPARALRQVSTDAAPKCVVRIQRSFSSDSSEDESSSATIRITRFISDDWSDSD